MSRQTVTAWLKKVKALPPLETTLAPYQVGDVLELDEVWSFVKRRKNKRWIWLALCRRTRQIVAFVIGCRGKRICRRLWKAIPAQYKAAHCFADRVPIGWRRPMPKSLRRSNSLKTNPKPTPITWRDSTAHCDKDAEDWSEKPPPFPNATTCTRPLFISSSTNTTNLKYLSEPLPFNLFEYRWAANCHNPRLIGFFG